MSALVPGSCGISDPLAHLGGSPGELLNTIICTFGETMTVAGFLLFCWFVVSSISYVRSQSIAMPIVLLLLIGGATVPQLPSVGLQVAAIGLLAGTSGIVVLVARRIDRI